VAKGEKLRKLFFDFQAALRNQKLIFFQEVIRKIIRSSEAILQKKRILTAQELVISIVLAVLVELFV